MARTSNKYVFELVKTFSPQYSSEAVEGMLPCPALSPLTAALNDRVGCRWEALRFLARRSASRDTYCQVPLRMKGCLSVPPYL